MGKKWRQSLIFTSCWKNRGLHCFLVPLFHTFTILSNESTVTIARVVINFILTTSMDARITSALVNIWVGQTPLSSITRTKIIRVGVINYCSMFINKGVAGGPFGPSREGPGVGHKIVSDTKQMTKKRKKMTGKREKCVKKKKLKKKRENWTK